MTVIGQAGKSMTALAMVMALSACASLPISGPTGKQVEKAAENPTPAGESPFRIVAVDTMAAIPLAPPRALPRGDDRLPPLRVDDKGEIFVPFVGRLRAGGHTAGELSTMIRKALKGLSQDPQVMVSVAQSVTNSVIVGGEVGRPGRLTLTTNRESLADVIALAGGWRGEGKDIAVQVTRGPRRIEYRLAEIMAGADHEMRIQPADRIELIKRPQTFAVLGAAGRVEQINFSAPALSLAEALALSGGPNPNLGDAKAVFVMRFEKGADGKEAPVVYHFNMMNAGTFFLAQRFAMRDKDVLYVGNAAANQPSKLIQLVSQMFSPIVAVESALVNTGAL